MLKRNGTTCKKEVFDKNEKRGFGSTEASRNGTEPKMQKNSVIRMALIPLTGQLNLEFPAIMLDYTYFSLRIRTRSFFVTFGRPEKCLFSMAASTSS